MCLSIESEDGSVFESAEEPSCSLPLPIDDEAFSEVESWTV